MLSLRESYFCLIADVLPFLIFSSSFSLSLFCFRTNGSSILDDDITFCEAFMALPFWMTISHFDKYSKQCKCGYANKETLNAK